MDLRFYLQSHFQLPDVNACHAKHFGLHTHYTDSLFGVNAFTVFNINLWAHDMSNQKSGYICQIAQYLFIFLLCNHAKNVKDCFYSTLSLLTGIYVFWCVILWATASHNMKSSQKWNVGKLFLAWDKEWARIG